MDEYTPDQDVSHPAAGQGSHAWTSADYWEASGTTGTGEAAIAPDEEVETPGYWSTAFESTAFEPAAFESTAFKPFGTAGLTEPAQPAPADPPSILFESTLRVEPAPVPRLGPPTGRASVPTAVPPPDSFRDAAPVSTSSTYRSYLADSDPLVPDEVSIDLPELRIPAPRDAQTDADVLPPAEVSPLLEPPSEAAHPLEAAHPPEVARLPEASPPPRRGPRTGADAPWADLARPWLDTPTAAAESSEPPSGTAPLDATDRDELAEPLRVRAVARVPAPTFTAPASGTSQPPEPPPVPQPEPIPVPEPPPIPSPPDPIRPLDPIQPDPIQPLDPIRPTDPAPLPDPTPDPYDPFRRPDPFRPPSPDPDPVPPYPPPPPVSSPAAIGSAFDDEDLDRPIVAHAVGLATPEEDDLSALLDKSRQWLSVTNALTRGSTLATATSSPALGGTHPDLTTARPDRETDDSRAAYLRAADLAAADPVAADSPDLPRGRARGVATVGTPVTPTAASGLYRDDDWRGRIRGGAVNARGTVYREGQVIRSPATAGSGSSATDAPTGLGEKLAKVAVVVALLALFVVAFIYGPAISQWFNS